MIADGCADAAGGLIACRDLEDLPARCQALFENGRDFCLGTAWFRNLVANGLPPGARACFGVLMQDGEAAAVLPLQQSATGALASLTNCYTCLYHPLIAAGDRGAALARRLGRAVGRLGLRRPLMRLECLPADWPALDAFIEGLRAGGLAVRHFEQFGNWYEPVGGRSWEEYLAARPGSLRELLRRRGRRMRQDGIRFEIIAAPQDVARGIAAYEAVYRRSWKPCEPFPRFNAGLMQEAARARALRLGLCWRGDAPIAAQLWILAHGRAVVMKLAHDEAHRALSPGTWLTAQMIARLLQEGAAEIDFGRGDDPYKRLWAGRRRQRIGLLIVDPRRPGGLLSLCRHDLGRAFRAARRRFERPGLPEADHRRDRAPSPGISARRCRSRPAPFPAADLGAT
jgi:hypothetical protein